MKKWVCRVNSMFGDKGKIPIWTAFQLEGPNQSLCNSPIRYGEWPDLFEEVEEETDEELLLYFLFQQISGIYKSDVRDVAKILLSQNAINPEFIKKLRSES